MAASFKEAAKKHSKFHPLRPCSTCILCGKTRPYYTHYESWADSEKEFLIRHWKAEPEPDSCICVAHQKEAQRTHAPGFTPKWSAKDTTVQPSDTCMYPGCTSTSPLITPAFAPKEEIQAFLHAPGDTGPLLVCKQHYQEIYRKFQATPCASCGIKPKQGRFNRHSPNNTLINQLIGESITPTDCICLGCYKAQLAMIKSHEQASQLSNKIKSWEIVRADSSTDTLTKAVLHSVLHVANEFNHERAVLLPDVSQVFLTQYLGMPEGTSENETILESPEGTVNFSSKWLLKQLILHLHPHIVSKCIHKKFGTLLFRKGGDLLTSLSWALGARKYEATEESFPVYMKHCREPDRAKVLAEAGDILNDIIHKEIAKHSCHELKVSMNNFNIDEQINKIDPSLWLFIQSITRTVKQRAGIPQEVEVEEDVLVKKLRRYYIACLLLYCANIQNPTAMHILMAETIQSCGGSHKLIKICNQFGITASNDTHDRFVADIAEMERSKTLWDSLPRNHFTIASVDNFDMLQSHAAVYCGDQSRSYHGTTLQIVQPNPVHITGSGLIKRTLVCSPASSPHKLGKVGPKRRRTVQTRNLTQQLQAAKSHVAVTPQQTRPPVREAVTMEGFHEQPAEERERRSLQSKMLVYMFIKQAINADLSGGIASNLLHEFKDLYGYSTQGTVNKSNIYYMELIDEHPDSADTMRCVSDLVLHTSSSEVQNGYVVLVGDGKTYQHLMKIKQTYGQLLERLLIFPGDWHVLANLQPVLLKIYYDAGLKELAEASGFKGETLTSLQKCSNFKRTHQFLLQAWQAIIRSMIQAFNSNLQLSDVTSIEDVTVRDVLKSTEPFTELQGEFLTYLSTMASVDDTWKFWHGFVFADCLSYIQLFLAIRCQNWDLRTSALKLMAPLFMAFDRTTYQHLIPYHLTDLQKFPPDIVSHLRTAFTVSINEGKGHAVALDEAHEMCINKDLKMGIVHPTKSYIQKMSLFLRYRVSVHKNLLCQLFPHLNDGPKPLFTIFSTTSETKEREENIVTMLTTIKTKALLPASVQENRGLLNSFSGLEATPEQRADLLRFREIGIDDLKNYINHHVLNTPSTNAPLRQHKLLTMAPPKKVSKALINQKQKELKQVNKCLRARLAWCNRTGQKYDPKKEQYSVYPRAIADENGQPVKGSKSIWKDQLKKRYKGPIAQVVSETLPSEWSADSVILDAMFFLNCKPLRSTQTIRDYSVFLFNRFLLPHYQAQVKEVHMLFDAPSVSTTFNPKLYEQRRRDDGKCCSHQHVTFTPSTNISVLSWSACIACRQCKRSIIEAIGLSYMQSVRLKLRPGQTLYLSGCFGNNCTLEMSGDQSLPSPARQYHSNSAEADMRIWRHVAQTTARHVLVYSPDTDIYNIGLSVYERLNNKDVYIQLNVPHSQTKLYLHLNNLIEALQLDPDLANLERTKLPNIFQVLFITSGCDYVSYFAGLGKTSFFHSFFQHAQFITGRDMLGSLSDTTEELKEAGFLAFLRLIGTLYFKKHYSALISLKGVKTPQQLFHACDEPNEKEKHLEWYNIIRAIVSDRITCEQDRMPSHTSMWRHWLRSCWVASMWSNAPEDDIQHSLSPPEVCGWMKTSDGSYTIDWDCPSTQQHVQDTIDFLTKGCGCKKGCVSQRCGCRKAGHPCGPGCSCQNCTNVLPDANVVDQEFISTREVDSSNSSDESDESGEETSNIETEIVYPDIYDEQNNFEL